MGIDLGYQVTSHVRVALGYQFLFWNDVIRPGGQPDLAVDASQSPLLQPVTGTPAGLNRPEVFFKHTDFWAQGINISAHISY